MYFITFILCFFHRKMISSHLFPLFSQSWRFFFFFNAFAFPMVWFKYDRFSYFYISLYTLIHAAVVEKFTEFFYVLSFINFLINIFLPTFSQHFIHSSSPFHGIGVSAYALVFVRGVYVDLAKHNCWSTKNERKFLFLCKKSNCT